MLVKICGIRREEDALLAAEYGADAIGLLVGQTHHSRDFISPALAAQICGILPDSVKPVLVTQLEGVNEIETLLLETGIKTVQLHSEITPEAIRNLRQRLSKVSVLKSVHVISTASIDYPEPFREVVDGFVLDSINAATHQVGGTGLTHDWSISREIVERYSGTTIFLAGGLHPGNVRAAIELVKPCGVDVNSGTKGADGFKDPCKLQTFIDEAKRANHI